MKKRYRVAAWILTAVLGGGLLSGCGTAGKTESAAAETESVPAPASNSGTTITILNSKSEIQIQMEEMAKKYSEEKGVNVQVYYSSDTIAAHLSTRYASNTPYTISMVDAKDIYGLAEEHAVDLSDQDWVNDTDYAIGIGGRIYGFPICVEARGVIYNAAAIRKITGKTFDPSAYTTLDSFRKLLKQLSENGMKTPVGIMKEDWSLGAHYFAEIYEQQPDPDQFITQLTEGNADLINNQKFNSLMDTFDTLKEFNYMKAGAVSADREVSEEYLAEGKIAFMYGGNWDWSELNAYYAGKDMGMMPVPQNTDDGTNEKLVGGGSKYFFIDNLANTTDAQRAAAKDFLNWWANDPEGQSFLVNDCALVPAFRTNTLEVSDPLGQSVKQYADAGELIPNYNFLPDDHFSIIGASMQKYLANVSNREQLAKEAEKYWKTAKVVAH